MSDQIYLSIDMDEISKAEFYEARKNAQYVKFMKPYGFYFSRGAQRVVYVTQDGKFYCGKLDAKTYEGNIDTFEYLGVQIAKPVCVYKRPHDTKAVVAKAKEVV
jgi:hypothetical protein